MFSDYDMKIFNKKYCSDSLCCRSCMSLICLVHLHALISLTTLGIISEEACARINTCVSNACCGMLGDFIPIVNSLLMSLSLSYTDGVLHLCAFRTGVESALWSFGIYSWELINIFFGVI